MPSTSPLRELLAATALQTGADAPTLCTPWTVQDLLAHLVVRETRPDALPGIGLDLPALRRHTAKVQRQVARDHSLDELAQKVRQGPPSWWPLRVPVLDRAVNTAELAVHLEDIVRAQPGWTPTELDHQTQEQLWKTVATAGRMLYRGAPVGVVAVAEGFGRQSLRRPPGEAGTVVLRGTPLELVLHAFGRQDVARVETEGSEQEVAALARHARAV